MADMPITVAPDDERLWQDLEVIQHAMRAVGTRLRAASAETNRRFHVARLLGIERAQEDLARAVVHLMDRLERQQ